MSLFFSRFSGSLFIALSAIGFGSMALCANIAYANGMDTASLLALRFMIGAAILGALAQIQGRPWPPRKTFLSLTMMGLVYASMAFSYFSALHHAQSSTVALVLYVYPIMVAGLAALLKMDRFGTAEQLAVAGSSLGLLVMLGTSLQGSMTGFGLALLSAVCYAVYILLGTRVSNSVNPITSSCLMIAVASMVFLLISTINGMHFPATLNAWLAVGYIAIVSTAMSITAFVAGLKRVGPTMAAILSTVEPIVTVSLGIAFLHESLKASSLAGGVLIICSALGLTLARLRLTDNADSQTTIGTKTTAEARIATEKLNKKQDNKQ